MHREHHRWHSPSLDRTMELLVFGHAGARAIVFPTSRGRFFEWEDRGLIAGLREPLERGWLQLYCVDSVDNESWYNWGAHPGYRAWRHNQYLHYIYSEVMPLSTSKNSNPFLMTMGASFGAFHAASFGLKYADKVDRVIGLSGLYDIRRFTGGYSDDMVYFNNPTQFIEHEWEAHRLAALRHVDIILVVGNTDPLAASSRDFSAALWRKGIGNALREWDGWQHDWQYWERMLKHYLNGHD